MDATLFKCLHLTNIVCISDELDDALVVLKSIFIARWMMNVCISIVIHQVLLKLNSSMDVGNIHSIEIFFFLPLKPAIIAASHFIVFLNKGYYCFAILARNHLNILNLFSIECGPHWEVSRTQSLRAKQNPWNNNDEMVRAPNTQPLAPNKCFSVWTIDESD